MRAYRTATITGLIVGAIAGTLALTPIGLDIEDGLGLQWLFQIRGALEPPSGIFIVNTAELSSTIWESPDTVDADGVRACVGFLRQSSDTYPPRCLYTELVERLDRWGASVIVFDVFFGEPGYRAEDEALASAIERANRVVLLQRLRRDATSSGVVTESLQSPIPRFAAAAAGLGSFPLPKVPARVGQFWTFKTGIGDAGTLPAVALQVNALQWLEPMLRVVWEAHDAGAVPQIPIEIDSALELTRLMRSLRSTVRSDQLEPNQLVAAVAGLQGRSVSAAERSLLEALARLYVGPDSYFINFYGPPGTIRTIHAGAVLKADAAMGTKLQSQIRNSAVFVGWAAQSNATQRDGHYTVFSRADGLDLSGVEIAASAYANLVNDQVLKRPNNFRVLLIVFVGCVSVGIGCYSRSVVGFVASTLGVAALYVAASAVLFVQRDLWMPVILPVVGQFVTIGVCLVLRAGFIRGPPKIIHGVCLLTDIGHYTETTEKFRLRPRSPVHHFLLRVGFKKSPLMSALRAYFRLLGTVIESRGGTVLHQIGDSMICIWRIRMPLDNPMNGEEEEQRSQSVRSHACQAALEIVQRVSGFNETIAIYADSGDRLEFPTRIGMDLGQFETGYFGRTFRTELLLIGNPANTAARLEQLNKVLGTQILASQRVVLGLSKYFVTRWVGTFVLSGKSEEVDVFELRQPRDSGADVSDAFCQRFEDALRYFAEVARTSHSLPAEGKMQAWARVAEKMGNIRQDGPDDGPTEFFTARARRYSESPPEHVPWPVRMASKETA